MLNALDIEFALARRLGPRMYTICPNVYWGLGFNHELDLCVLTKADWVWEIEIKTNVFDLKRDLDKYHHHASTRIRALFFAVPDTMKDKALELCPERAGIWIVNQQHQCTLIRKPKLNRDARKFTDAEKFKLIRLATMRLWDRKPRPIYSDGIAAAVSKLVDKGYEVSWYTEPDCSGFKMSMSKEDVNDDVRVRKRAVRSMTRLEAMELMFPEQAFLTMLESMENELSGKNVAEAVNLE